MQDSTLLNPYDYTKYPVQKVRVLNSKKKNKYKSSLSNYKFSFDVQGDNINKELLLTCSYIGGDVEECSFILEEGDIDKLIINLEKAKDIIQKGKQIETKLKELHSILNNYLDAGYIESITIERNDTLLPPYFNSNLYMAFVIRPIFKIGITIPSEVNTSFNFLEVLHMDINEDEYDKTMNYIRHYHDIPITIIGWDRDEIIKKRYNEALKDADKRIKDMKDGTKKKDDSKYLKIMQDTMGIPTAVMTQEAIKNSMKDILNKK